jgi:hypothetical protein
MPKISAICIKTDGTLVSFNLDDNVSPDTFDIQNIPKNLLNSKGTNELTRECDFDYANTVISLYAWTEGRAGKENKYDLPPPVDNELYFGNMFAICHDGQNNELISLSVAEWEDFYEMAFGGFEDLGSEDSYSEDDDEEEYNDEMKDFIVNDLDALEEIEDESYHPSDESESEYDDEDDEDDAEEYISEYESESDGNESEDYEDELENDEEEDESENESDENESDENDESKSDDNSHEDESVPDNGIAETETELEKK